MNGKTFRQVEGVSGLDREQYDPSRDTTHVVIPLRVTGPTADAAVGRAQFVAAAISGLLDDVDDVEWVTNELEATYAILQNLATALEALPRPQRTHLLLVAPGVERLRELLRPTTG